MVDRIERTTHGDACRTTVQYSILRGKDLTLFVLMYACGSFAYRSAHLGSKVHSDQIQNVRSITVFNFYLICDSMSFTCVTIRLHIL